MTNETQDFLELIEDIKKENKSLRDEIERLKKDNEWFPIETYNREPAMVSDGDRVALYIDGYMPWNEGKSIVFLKGKPTHWRPLPTPPVELRN